MKNEKIDFDELKRGVDSFTHSKGVKIAVGVAFTIAGIYVVGKVMKLLAGTVSEYKGLRRSLNEPTSSSKNGTNNGI